MSPSCFGFELPARTAFRPRGIAPPRRVPPLGGLRACCIPLPILGFAVFRMRGRHLRRVSDFTAEAVDGFDRHVPLRRVSYPPKDSPHRQPFRVTTFVAPLPFFLDVGSASARVRCQIRVCSYVHRGRRLRGVAPPMSPWRRIAVANDSTLYPSWALFPFKVLPDAGFQFRVVVQSISQKLGSVLHELRCALAVG